MPDGNGSRTEAGRPPAAPAPQREPSSGPARDEPEDGSANPGRHETPIERLDRNWAELLQEVRVIQTGVQLLTGFLLTLPFQQRFGALSHTERAVYLCTAATSICATVFLQAPVVVHRALFRSHRRNETVLVAHRLTMIGMVLLGLAIVGVSFTITATVLGVGTGAGAGVAALVLIVAMWFVVPLLARLRSRRDD